MKKENYGNKLHDAVAEQDKSTADRFANADSIMLKPRSKPSTATDSFSMPHSDHALIRTLISRATNTKNKSEIVRAGLHALQRMDKQEFDETIGKLEKMMPGRKY